MAPKLRNCATPGCNVETTSVTGYCRSNDACRRASDRESRAIRKVREGARKGSTEGKTARGTTPDAGSTPAASTPDPEFQCMQEDLWDLQQTVAQQRRQIDELFVRLLTLQDTVTGISKAAESPTYYTKTRWVTGLD